MNSALPWSNKLKLHYLHFFQNVHIQMSPSGGLVVGVLAIGHKLRWFNPGRRRWIFKGDKNLQRDLFWRESKAVSAMS
jgi:hypothetical protein